MNNLKEPLPITKMKGEEKNLELSTWRSNNKFRKELTALKSKAGINVKIVLIMTS